MSTCGLQNPRRELPGSQLMLRKHPNLQTGAHPTVGSLSPKDFDGPAGGVGLGRLLIYWMNSNKQITATIITIIVTCYNDAW